MARHLADVVDRLRWPQGIRCLWFCPPWHRPGAHPTYAEYRAGSAARSAGEGGARSAPARGPRGPIDPAGQ